MPKTSEEYLLERFSRASTWLLQNSDAEIITNTCWKWVSDLLNSGEKPYSRNDLPKLPLDLSLVARLSDAGYSSFSDALAWQIDGGSGIEPAEAALVGRALAIGSGQAYVDLGPEKADGLGFLISTIDHQAWEAFANSASEKLRENSESLELFVAYLRGIVKKSNEEPDSVTEFPPQRGSMALIVEQFARGGSIQDVWQTAMSPIIFRRSAEFEILRRAAPELFAELIDELPHPAVVAECLNSRALRESISEASTLLGLARTAFDSQGCWQRNGMAVVLLLQLLTTQLLSSEHKAKKQELEPEVPSDVANVRDIVDIENLPKEVGKFQQLVDEVLDVLFARSDSVELAWHWMETLFPQAPQPLTCAEDRRQNRFVVNRIGILISSLSTRLAPRRSQDAWIADAKPLARQYRAISVLSVMAFSHVGGIDIAAAALGLLKRNDIELTRAAELIRLPGAPMRTIPGAALAGIPNVALWLTKTWSAIRFEREQAWRHSPARSGVDANPAEILGIWGLGIIETLASEDARRDDVRKLWQALEVSFREARLVEPRNVKDFWSQAVACLFAWWPRLFMLVPTAAETSENSASDVSTNLGERLAPYININADFMSIIVSLYQEGISGMTLDSAVYESNQDLLRIVRGFLHMTPSLRHPRVWNQDWLAILRKIETQIARDRLRSRNK